MIGDLAADIRRCNCRDIFTNNRWNIIPIKLKTLE